MTRYNLVFPVSRKYSADFCVSRSSYKKTVTRPGDFTRYPITVAVCGGNCDFLLGDFVFDGQNTIEARKTCNGGRDLPIRCKVFYGLSKEHEALLFAVQTGISSELTAGEQLRAKLVAHEENACDFVSVTEDTGVRFALDGIRAPWKIYCIRSAYYIYKSYGTALYHEMLSVLVDAWGGDSDSFLSGILHGMARFLALYQGEYSRERLVGRLRTVHPKTITRLAQNDTGNVADRHMKQILSIYNGAGRAHSLPCKR